MRALFNKLSIIWRKGGCALPFLFLLVGPMERAWADDVSALYGNAAPAAVPRVTAPTPAATALRLTLLPSFVANRDDVYLGDVSQCEGATEACASLSGILVTKAPAPGMSVVVSGDDVRQLLAREAPGVLVDVTSASGLSVSSRLAYLDEDVVARRLEEVVDRFNTQQDQVEIKVAQTQLIRKVPLGPGASHLRFRDLEERLDTKQEIDLRHFRNLTRVPFTVESEDEDEEGIVTGEARVRFQVRIKVPVAKALIPTGTVIGENDLTYAWRHAEEMNQSFAIDQKDIVGRITRSPIRSGETPRYAQLAKEQLVRMGEEVSLIIRHDGLEIRGRAKAMASGGMGDRISLQHLATKKTFSGLIVGAGVAEVRLGQN